MSYDVALWDARATPSLEDVKEKYVRFCESKDTPEQGTGKLAAFFAALERRYPSINDYPEDDLQECPWACGFERSSDFAVLCMRSSVADAVMPIVTELAKTHGLVCYDPQQDSVHYP